MLLANAMMMGGVLLPKFVAGSSAFDNDNIPLTINKPAGVQAGDLLIFSASTGEDNNTWSTLSGWTELKDPNTPPNHVVAAKIAGSSEPSSYSFTPNGGEDNFDKSGMMLAFRNAAYAGIGTQSLGTGGTTATASSVTLDVGDTAIALFVSAQDDINASVPPSGWDLVLRSAFPSESRSHTLWAYSKSGAGATGNAVLTYSNSGFSSAGVQLKLSRG